MVFSVLHPPQALRFVLIEICVLFLFLFGRVFLLDFWLTAWTVALAAALLACFWQDKIWWPVLHLFFFPLALWTLQLHVSPVWYLLAFALCWLLFGSVARERVPLYLSSAAALARLEPFIPQQARFMDVGAGTGSVLAWLQRHRVDLQLAGVEQSWLPWLLGRCRLRSHVFWLHGDYADFDFSDLDVVYAFLSPVPMATLWEKIQKEMRPGTLFVSNTFAVPGVEPDQIIEIGDWKKGRLLLWHL